MQLDFGPMTNNDINVTVKRMQRDFPPSERAPAFALRRQLKSGVFEGYALRSETGLAAYAVNVVSPCERYILLNYLAVDSQTRGQGVGYIMLAHLKSLYADKRAIIAEVEHPADADGQADREMREARVRFYEKCGFMLIPDVDYSIFGVKMALYFWSPALDAAGIRPDIETIMNDLYRKFLPRVFWSQLRISLV